MKKKQRNLAIIVLALVIIFVIYLVVLKLNAKQESDNSSETDIKASSFWSYDENPVGITLITEKNSFEFDYNKENLKWEYDQDNGFDVNQTVITTLKNAITGLSYYRKISDYKDLESFNLETPPLTIKIKLDNGETVNLLFSNTSFSDGTTYFMLEDGDVIYTTDSKLNSYADFTLYDFYQKTDIPSITDYELVSVSIKNSNGNILICKDEELTEAKKEEYTGSDFSDKLAVYKYFYPEMGQTETTASEAEGEDSSVLYNYITEFCFNNAVNYKPTDAELDSYGLLNPETSVEIRFNETSAEKNGSAMETSSDFTYTLFIGKPVTDEKSEYYVRISCNEQLKDTSIYDTRCVYKMNSLYCKYFIGFSENRINGVYRYEQSLLEDNTVPVLNKSSINSLSISNSDKTLSITRKGEEWIFNTASGEFAVNAKAMEQLVLYLTESGLMDYSETVVKDADEDSLAKYNLTAQTTDLTINYEVQDEEKNTVPISWTLKISSDRKYVTASNTTGIYKMSDSLLSYICSIDEDILSGAKVYNEAENSDIPELNQ